MNKIPELYYTATAIDQNGNFSSVESDCSLADMVDFISNGWGRLVDVFQFERRADGRYAGAIANEDVARAWLEKNSNWVLSGGQIPDFVHEYAPSDLCNLLNYDDEPPRPDREEHGTLHRGGSGVL